MAQNRYYTSTAQPTQLYSALDNVSGTIQVVSDTGVPTSYPFTYLIEWGTSNAEVVTVTQAPTTGSGYFEFDNCLRGQDGTTAVAHDPGAPVVHGVSGRDFNEPQAHIGAHAGVHGVAGNVVGDTDTQTLSNKTLTAASATADPTTALGLATKQYVDAHAPGWNPGDHGLAAWTYDPGLISAVNGNAGSGNIFLMGIRVRENVTVSKLYFAQGATAAAGATAGANWAGLYSTTTLLASAALDTAGTLNYFTSGLTASIQAIPISSQSLTPGQYWIAFLMTCTTMPTLCDMAGQNSLPQVLNVGLTGTYRYAQGGSGTTLPSTTPVMTQGGKAFWAAVG